VFVVNINLDEALSRDKNVYYYRNIYEVDLVFEKGKKVFPVEVKYKDSISRRDLTGLLNFKRKFNPEVGVVVTQDLSGEDNSYGLRILFFPAWLFLLLVG
jgi:predicted AAA+ superfamily ATPase